MMGYDRKFFERHATQYRDWERSIGRDICYRFNVQSAVDFGCGVGSYLEGMLDAGIKRIRGFELSYDNSIAYTPESVGWCIEKKDITQPIAIERYDLSLSIEVAEHLQPEGTAQFLDNLTSASNHLIVFSAAPPGQRGTHHINCRPREFWVSAIQERGFIYLEDDTRKCAEDWKAFKAADWVLRNLAIFKRISAIEKEY